ncbi:hypothetical protein TNCV_3603991 [Trichonephila clavipes]|nr:hypothetical protein TNCV_3603991 [Trichonephila clavipes]
MLRRSTRGNLDEMLLAFSANSPGMYRSRKTCDFNTFLLASPTKVGNRLGSLQVPWDWAHSGQSFLWLSKTLRFLGHDSIFVSVCGDNALCSSEGQGNFRLSQLGSLLGSLVGSFIAGDPNRAWGPL